MLILPNSAKNARKKRRIGSGVRAPRGAKATYQRELFKFVNLLREQSENVSDLVRDGEDRARVAQVIEGQITLVNAQNAIRVYKTIATDFADRVSEDVRIRTENIIKRAFGVPFANIISSPEIQQQIDLAVTTNVNLIKTISQDHFGRIIQAVNNNYQGLLTEGETLASRIKEIGGITQRHAKFIARDQTAKLASSFSEIQQKDAGFEGYIWRNAQDERVVGNPAGLYPKGHPGHMNHWVREGKKFEWAKPPPDGHPGNAFNCRCFAEPVIDLETLKAEYV